MATNLINLSVMKSIYKILNKYNSNSSLNNNQILEPLTTIIKLAIISFKPVGTKIAIDNNKIYIQNPGYFQSASRWMYGNNREELHYILKPILRSINLYDPAKSDELLIIYSFSVEGLRVLKKSYLNSNSTLCHALDLYITLLEEKLKRKDLSVDSYNNLLCIKNNLNLSQNTKINLDKLFLEIWKPQDIKLISEMFSLAKDNKSEEKSYLKAIESILDTKEKITNKIIIDTNKLI
jgi:hypothetical protein